MIVKLSERQKSIAAGKNSAMAAQKFSLLNLDAAALRRKLLVRQS